MSPDVEAGEEVPDDLDLGDLDPSDLADLPAKRVDAPQVGVTMTAGVVHVELPAAATVGFALGARLPHGLRIDLLTESWTGPAYVPGAGRTVPVAVPSAGIGLAYEAPTSCAARAWVGASASAALVSIRPLAMGPVVAGRVGVDVGKDALAWTLCGSVGVLVAPSLPALAGPAYRSVAPLLSVSTGPSIRL